MAFPSLFKSLTRRDTMHHTAVMRVMRLLHHHMHASATPRAFVTHTGVSSQHQTNRPKSFTSDTVMLRCLASQRVHGMGYVLYKHAHPTLYVNLSNDMNATGLLELRGPSFTMPENSHFARLDEHTNADNEPSAQDYADMINMYYEEDVKVIGMGEQDSGVVFAGCGEPLMRLEKMIAIVEMVKSRRHGVPFRIMTNGLLGNDDVADAITKDRLFDRVTVSLASADPLQYLDIMKPLSIGQRQENTFTPSLSTVCTFIETLAKAGIEVECSVVDRGDVNIQRVRELAFALGAVDLRVRSFHK